MKPPIFTLALLMLCNILWSQSENKSWSKVQEAKQQSVHFQDISVLNWIGELDPDMQETASDGSLLNLDLNQLQQLISTSPEAIQLDIPTGSGSSMRAELVRNHILTGDFQVTTASSEANPVPYETGLYYRGIVDGDPNSWIAISFFNNSIMAVLHSSKDGDMVLGKLKDDPQERYVLYATSDFQESLSYNCDVLKYEEHGTEPGYTPEATNPANCVRIYFECEYNMYQENGSVANTVNYLTGIYNVVKILYDNENVNTVVSEIFVWDTPDSYATGPSTSDALYSFRSGRTSFNGDVAHLISRGAPSGGGVAWVNALCSSYNYAYSYIYNWYNQFPSYSWTVNVIAHEMGHNLGSQHTHDCVWDVDGDGNASEAVDGCGPAAGYSGNGNCPTGPYPLSNGGTVMSYCHLTSSGINLANGFGQLPGDRIRDRVYNASCLTPCSNCPVTVSTSKTDVSCNGGTNGTATATGNGGVGNYTYLWSFNNATTQTITGLSAGSYTVTVTDDGGNGCSTTSSVTINEPSAIALNTSSTPEAVPGAGNGSIDLSVSGGTPSYSYNWSNGATTQDINGLTAGTYSVTVTDQNNCTATTSVLVESNGCAAYQDVFPYQEGFEGGLGLWAQGTNDNFNWTRNSGSTPTNGTGPSGAAEGTYYVFAEAKGNNGAAHLISPCLNIDGLSNTSVSFAYHMNGNHIGTLSLQVSTNNGASWTTIWNQSGSQGNNWLTASVSLDNHKSFYTRLRFVGNVQGGPRGDLAVDDITVQADPPPCDEPDLTLSSVDVSCAGGNNGSASVSATGGTGSYSYLWSNGETTSSITGIAAGTYNVTVADNTGCEAYGSVTVGEPAAMQLDFAVTPTSGAGNSDGEIDLTVTNGVPNYSYAWSNGSTTEDITGLAADIYSVIVTDANGCTASGSAEVIDPPSCNTVILPQTEGFENDFGIWGQASTDDFDWSRNSGSTQTKNTGPSGASENNWYAYTESNGNPNGGSAVLESPCIDLTSAVSPELEFDWHMYGNQMGSLSVEVSDDNGSSWTPEWTLSGDQGDGWTTQTVSLASYQGSIVRIRFTGTLGGVRSDMAIDAVGISDVGALLPGIVSREDAKSWDWIDIYPNPSKDYVIVNLTSEVEQFLPVSLLSASGKMVQLEEVQTHIGNNTITVKLGNLPAGVYLLSLGKGEHQQSKRLVIHR